MAKIIRPPYEEKDVLLAVIEDPRETIAKIEKQLRTEGYKNRKIEERNKFLEYIIEEARRDCARIGESRAVRELFLSLKHGKRGNQYRTDP